METRVSTLGISCSGIRAKVFVAIMYIHSPKKIIANNNRFPSWARTALILLRCVRHFFFFLFFFCFRYHICVTNINRSMSETVLVSIGSNIAACTDVEYKMHQIYVRAYDENQYYIQFLREKQGKTCFTLRVGLNIIKPTLNLFLFSSLNTNYNEPYLLT